MERHDLLHEFPDYQEKIHELKVSDQHFRTLFDEYHELEHEIHRVNTDVEVVTDEHAHELKAKLLFIKDALYSILTKDEKPE
ncbi:YdcH family protein [Flavobacterium sp. W22_SRS_FP1]|uniref:YdcH family protein n=1 Tax=Flavobacterium sp. W22_SRS_FP1 TaxID=3240276 RepID=UPI003F93DABC